MLKYIKNSILFVITLYIFSMSISCIKEQVPPDSTDSTDSIKKGPIIDFSQFKDYYLKDNSVIDFLKWGIYNVKDPAIRKFGDYYYAYSTDVKYGGGARPGIQIRKSKNLVEWTFVGWAFYDITLKGLAYIESIGAIPGNSLRAPSLVKVGEEYRLYYSLTSNVEMNSCICLATSTNPETNWNELDVVVGSGNTGVQANAVDPSVIITPEGEHWMVYGSSGDGIYLVQLNPETGLVKKQGDLGKRIARRGITNGKTNGNIEGAEIIYNKELNKYYLFVAYDWMTTKYNTRIGRSDQIEGPYYDMFGKDLDDQTDNLPMIIAPYQFNNHVGWQGVGHCSVFEDDGQYYFAHHALPVNVIGNMILHVRQLFWSKEGWPLISPERYAAQPLIKVDKSDIVGTWEVIDFNYRTIPGFGKEQTSPDDQLLKTIDLYEDGTCGNTGVDSWSYDYPWLSLKMEGKSFDLHVSIARDWENILDTTIVFTGNKLEGLPLWGKKIADSN